MTYITFAYHTTDPADYSDFDGACVGRERIPDKGVGNDVRAAQGAERLGLKPGRYIAVQETVEDGASDVPNWSFIVDVMAPTLSTAKIVKS